MLDLKAEMSNALTLLLERSSLLPRSPDGPGLLPQLVHTSGNLADVQT